MNKSSASIAASSLVLLTAGALAAAFWLIFSEDPVGFRPVATVVTAGLAGALTCVSTRETYLADETPWSQALYSWLLTAIAGAGTSLGVFLLALIAFRSQCVQGYQYAGLGLFGAITGYLGASVVISGALKWRPAAESPLDRVSKEFDARFARFVSSVHPSVTRLIEEVILGPAIPPYKGHVAIKWTSDDSRPPQSDRHIAVWFDTISPDADTTAPVTIRGHGSAQKESEGTTEPAVIPMDVLLHVPTSRASPMQRTVSVPLSGRSIPASFVISEQELRDGGLPRDTLLEVRCRGLLVLIIDLHEAAGPRGRQGRAGQST
jgi:hypothetical protein